MKKSEQARLLARLRALKQSIPERPLLDVVDSPSLASAHYEIAELYARLGDRDAARAWRLHAIRWCRDSRAIIAALVMVKREIRRSPEDREARELYSELWQLAGLTGPPDPV